MRARVRERVCRRGSCPPTMVSAPSATPAQLGPLNFWLLSHLMVIYGASGAPGQKLTFYLFINGHPTTCNLDKGHQHRGLFPWPISHPNVVEQASPPSP